jgi:hypothetical protein
LFFRFWVCLCTVFEFPDLSFSLIGSFHHPFPPSIAVSPWLFCPFPPSCLPVSDPQISVLCIK